MELNLPSPQQIYDLSTQQLTHLQAQLHHNITKKQANKQNTVNNKTITEDEIESLKELLENISLEIQERKTLEFFTELCISDGTANKYVKEITDFNNQFKKLANQLLNNNNHNPNPKESQQIIHTQSYEIDQKTLNDRKISTASITTDEFSQQNHTIQTETTDFVRSATSQMTKKATQTITKKMGVGHTNLKKSKNAMQQFIKATLAKSKAVDYVSTKGGNLKKSPEKIATNGSHVSTYHENSTPMSTTKSIKPPSQGSQTASNTRRQAPSSTKTIPSSQKSIADKNDRESLIRKRNDAIQKMKSMKKPQTQSNIQNHPPQPPKKKGAKGLDAKSLVEMVKQQEDAKKRRQQQPLEERPKPKIEIIRQQKENKVQTINNKEKHLAPNSSQDSSRKQSSYSNEQTEQKISKKLTKQQNLSKTEELENEFPIKQQINPIYSSDTESDNDSVKMSCKKTISTKENLTKDEKYCPIPEQEIQQSIVMIKQHQKNTTETQPTLKSVSKQNPTVQNANQKVSTKKQMVDEVVESKSIHKISSVQFTKNQEFGKITQEQYNPNGYDAKSDDQQVQQQEQQQNNPLNNQQVSSTHLQSKPSQPNLKKPSSSEQTAKKSSIKNLKPKQQKQKQKKSIIEEQISSSTPLIDLQSNKIYNQQYWLHIKQQAETKIQRFKQEKQLERKERQLKAKLIQEESRSIKAELENNQKGRKVGGQDKNVREKEDKLVNGDECNDQTLSSQNTMLNKQDSTVLEQDDNDKFIHQQKANLKKIQSSTNTNGSSKKSSKKPATTSLIKQLKPTYPKPQFNYLQIYPTFNHIFNIFYTKPQSQSILDIPLIMKQMIQMFQTYLEYQKSKTNNFRPAIFMPFDNRNSRMGQFTDARLLLQHAQTTYVNLKTLVERVEIFNGNIQGEFQNATQEERGKTQFYRVVKTKQEVYDIITTSFLRRKGWKQLPHGQNLKANWNLFWSWSKPQIDMNKLMVFQRINHYPFNKNLSRKDLLYKNIDSFRKTHKVPFPYLPITYNLPKQFTQFSKRFHEQELINREKNYWIMKPIGKSRGRGIKLINSLGDLNYLDNIVVQKYISNPLLIDGYKFDMRIYVLVTSFHPLEAFVYREGFARFSTQKYSLEPMDMKNNFVHLTNFAINRHNQQANEQFTDGSKISLKSLKQKITKKGYSFASVWSQVHEIIIKSLLACSVSVPPFPAAFQLFGYDIMLDDTGQCSLIQINASPSLQRSYMIDDIIKQSLIDDIIQIVNPPAFSKEQAINVMHQRLSPEFRNFNNKKGQKQQQNTNEEDLIHLARILKYQKMRKYGEMPQKIGLFEMVAPSPMSKDLQKLIKSKSGINAPHNID